MNTPINLNPWSILDEMLDVDSRLFSNLRARASGRFPPVCAFPCWHAFCNKVCVAKERRREHEYTH